MSAPRRTPPWRALGLLLAGSLLSATASAQFDISRIGQMLSSPERLQRATSEMPVQEEVALGRDLTGQLLAHMPLLDDQATQAYVNQLGTWLALHTERADLPWRFAVTDTSTIGAFAAPGGHVLMTRGLLVMMQDEHQLAGVLAHEIAHVLRKHHLQAIMRDAQLSLAGDLVGGTQGLVSGIGALFGANTGSVASRVGTQVVAGVTAQMLERGMTLYGRGLDREDELEADRFGAVVAARAGYEPSGLPALLFTLDTLDASTPAYELMHSTHPPARERIERLAALLDGPLANLPSGLGDAQRFASMQQRLRR